MQILGAGPPEISPAALYLSSLGSDASRRGMISPLNTAAKILAPALGGSPGQSPWERFPWETLTAATVRFALAQMIGSSGTRKKALAALKGVARGAWELHKMETEVYRQIQGIKGRAGVREISGRHLDRKEVAALLSVCEEDRTLAGNRDAALISIAVATGARRAELASIMVSNVEEVDECRMRIRIRGKGDRQRTVYLESGAASKVKGWLEWKRRNGGERLFCPIRKDGMAAWDYKLSLAALDKILKKRAQSAGVPKVSWHDVRRTVAGNLLDAKVDISTVARVLGHANIETTARYDRRGDRAKVTAAAVSDQVFSTSKAYF